MGANEQDVIEWAQGRADVRAILVIGSRARRDHPADEWSDLDVVLFTTTIDAYRSGAGWLEAPGKALTCIPVERMDAWLEYVALYESGTVIDFMFAPLEELQQMVATAQLNDRFDRGYTILLDKDELAAQLPEPHYALSHEPPSAEEFHQLVQMFWLDALKTAKGIHRGDLWYAIERDRRMKRHLLKMLEWYAGSRDTWHEGRFMREWVDEETWNALNSAFGRFNQEDCWRALLSTQNIFRQRATLTAARLGFEYPKRLDRSVSQLIIQLRTQK